MGKFVKGVSGNPRGRPRGSVAAQTKLRRALEEHAPEILAKLVDRAKKGEPMTGKFLIERILPAARSAPVSTPVDLAGTPAEQAERIKKMLAAGALTIEEAHALLEVIGAVQAITDATELTERVRQIEARLAAITAKDQGVVGDA